MNTGLVLVPLSLLASLTFLLNRLHVPLAEPDDEVIVQDGYGFVGIVVFVVVVCVLTLLALSLVG
jgi:hypothetical protein